MPKKRPVHKDVLLVQDGNVTEIAGVYDVPPDEPASRAVINKRDKRKGLWMDIELVDDAPPPKKPVK